MEIPVNRNLSILAGLIVCLPGLRAQPPHIIVDQFGYRPHDDKVAVLSDPVAGYNASDAFLPGNLYQVLNTANDSVVFEGSPVAWNGGATHAQSGDRGWWFDFSAVNDTGTFVVRDVQNGVDSYPFKIDGGVYREILKAASRMFYYNRIGIAKEARYVGDFHADGVALAGDTAVWDVKDRSNASKVKDLRGGWMDAGDYNKYVTFAVGAIFPLLSAYQLNPGVFGDDFNIPESGNGLPDLLDEVIWELEWLKRMQDTSDGGTYLKMGTLSSGGSTKTPPSADNAKRYYYPTKSTAASVSLAAMLSYAATVFQSVPSLHGYADELLIRAQKAWTFFRTHPTDGNIDDGTIAAGDADLDKSSQDQMGVVAAVFLYYLTGDSTYNSYVVTNYGKLKAMTSTQWGMYSMEQSIALMFYALMDNADSEVRNAILNRKTESGLYNNGGWVNWDNNLDLYRAYMPDDQYHWGSNNVKAQIGWNAKEFVVYNLIPASKNDYEKRALAHLHYFHGLNPQNMTYLTSMQLYGAENPATQMFHSWFANNSAFDVAAPGYVTGGPNKSFKPDASYTGPALVPPMNQPPQKSYKNWNTSWPENSWEVTEPGIYYQAAYVKLVSCYATDSHLGQEAQVDSFVVLTRPEGGIYAGELFQVVVKTLPLGSPVTFLQWFSQNEEVATVDTFGVIRARAPGDGEIVVYNPVTGQSDTLFIRVWECEQSAYGAGPRTVPGKIETEDFDTGCGAYADSDGINSGNAYRPAEPVDIEACSEGGYDVGWTAAGEWLEYTIHADEAGFYNVFVRVAGTGNGSVEFITGEEETSSGSHPFEATGGWQNWKTLLVKDIYLNSGTQVMRFHMKSGGFNVNFFEFVNQIADEIPPQAPDNLSYALPTGTSVKLAWSAASDQSGIKGYYVYRDNARVNALLAEQMEYTMTGLAVGTTYHFQVSAVDVYGNESVRTDSLQIGVTGTGVFSGTMAGGMELYPNPSPDRRVSISIPAVENERVTLEVLNMQGKILYSGSFDFNLSHVLQLPEDMPAGAYLLKLSSKDSGYIQKLMIR